ncbi:MAG TPA: hypothetical protein ENG98_03665 [Actinobacteria bacterium]|nr:hypothetical protein [Actinomycetota bacterium]
MSLANDKRRISVTIRPRTILITIGVIAAVLVGANVVVGVIRQVTDQPFTGLDVFDLNAEQSIPSWFSSALLLVAAALTAGVAAKSRTMTWRWAGLAVMLLLASIDETIAVHERLSEPVGNLLNISDSFPFAWVLPFIVVGAALFPTYLGLLRSLDRQYQVLFVLSAAVYLGGAVGLEIIGGFLLQSLGPGVATELEVIIEESAEMLGMGLLVSSLYQLLSDRSHNPRSDELTQEFKTGTQPVGTAVPFS